MDLYVIMLHKDNNNNDHNTYSYGKESKIFK